MIPRAIAIAAEAEDAALDRVLKHDLRKPGLDEKTRAHRRAKRRTNRALRNLGLDLPNGRARHDAARVLGGPWKVF